MSGLRLQVWARLLKNSGQVTLIHALYPVTKQYNLVPANGRKRSAAGKVSVGLASHWSCVTGQWFIRPQAQGIGNGDKHHAFTTATRMSVRLIVRLKWALAASQAAPGETR